MELTEDDVPGAKLKFAKVQDHHVRDLKRWLACRGLPVSGNKNVLVERIEECIANGNNKKIFIGIDSGKCLEDKQQRMKLLNPLPPSPTPCTFPSTK